jgi:probable F420-dependent oxidoreductase
MDRPFRFGLQIRNLSPSELRSVARDAEAAGFDVLSTSDHVSQGWAPLLPLLAATDSTTRLRVCPLVLNNDFRHPVHLARDLASLDQLSGGRLEVGIGAGHAFTEYAAIGQRFDPPAVRKARLAESVEILRRLLDGDSVSFAGEHYQLEGVRAMRALQAHVPIMVAVNGRRALAHAAHHADIIGLFGLGRTLPDGLRHEVRWEADRLDRTVEYIWDQAGQRADRLELNALVQSTTVTAERATAVQEVVGRIEGLRPEDAEATPFLAIGSHAEIAEHLHKCRERWGISYFTVRELHEFAPVIALLRK